MMLAKLSAVDNGGKIDSIACIVSAEVSVATNGNKFVKGELRDSSDTMPFIQFGASWAPSPGSVVSFSGRRDDFAGSRSLKLDRLSEAPEGDFTEHLLPVSELFSIEEVEHHVRNFVHAKIRGPLRAVCVALLDELGDDFFRAPAAAKMHHAFVGGLAEHTLSMLELADKVVEHYRVFAPGLLDEELLFAGVLFHDACKVREYDAKNHRFVFTKRGALLGHVMDGALLVYKAFGLAELKDEPLRDRLVHIVLSHHGEQKYGAPVSPATPDAVIFHEIDMIDSRVGALRRLRMSATDGVSEYDRVFYGQIYFDGVSNLEASDHGRTRQATDGGGARG